MWLGRDQTGNKFMVVFSIEEPSQLGCTCLSPQERDRCMHDGCCFYCRGSRPSPFYMPRIEGKPHSSPAQGETLTTCAVILQLPSHHLTLPTTLNWDNRQHHIQAFMDSGAANNFIDQDFARELQILCMKCPIPLQMQALDGRPIGSSQVDYQTKPILLQVGVNHSETLSFFTAPENPLILGYPS